MCLKDYIHVKRTYAVCLFQPGPGLDLDLENVMSMPSAACVNFWGRGEMLALNIRFFIVYALTVAIVRPFYYNYVGKVKGNLEKGGTLGIFCYILISIGE